MDLEELRDSRERTGAPVLWLSCEGQIDVSELFSDNSYLSAILDRQGLHVAAPVGLRTKKAESFSKQALQCFWSKMKKKQGSCDVPDGFFKYTNQQEVTWQQYRLYLVTAAHQILGGKHVLILGSESGKTRCF